MPDPVWWLFFVVLVILLCLVTGYFCYSVLRDLCGHRSQSPSEKTIDADVNRYRNDFRTILKKENEEGENRTLMVTKNFYERRESNALTTFKPLPEEEETNRDVEEKPVAIEGEDNVDGEEDDLTEEEKKVMDQIMGIQGETDIYAKQIPFCLGGKNHLTYYEINEKFIRSSMGLTDINCNDNKRLEKRKHLVSLYIAECQKELKKRAENDEDLL